MTYEMQAMECVHELFFLVRSHKVDTNSMTFQRLPCLELLVLIPLLLVPDLFPGKKCKDKAHLMLKCKL